jgi:hypothetical protein
MRVLWLRPRARLGVVGGAFAQPVALAFERGQCGHRRTGSPGSWLPRRRDLRGNLVEPGRVDTFERWESQAALETFGSSGPDKEQRAAMLTVAVQEYIADVRPVFGERIHERLVR